MNKIKYIILYFTAFVSGFSLMGYEILGSRVLAPYFGSSVFVWGALISVFMLGLRLGYAVGGRLADMHNSFTELSCIIFCAAVFIFPVSYYGKTICNYVSSFPFDIKYSALAVSLILFTVPCICLGIIPPYLVRLSISKQNTIGSRVGNVYSVSTLGSIMGTLLVSFYMIGFIGTPKAIQLLCIPLIIAGFTLFLYSLIHKKHI